MDAQAKEEIWKGRIAQLAESGLSQRAFALQHGFGVSQVGYWARRLTPAPAAALVPVVVKQVTAPALVLRHAHGWALDIPAGTPAGWLAELLRSL
jgi:hypothetical protein